MSNPEKIELPDPPKIPLDLVPYLEALLATFPEFQMPKLPTADTPIQAVAWEARKRGRQDLLDIIRVLVVKQGGE